jgi:hypothetical protein
VGMGIGTSVAGKDSTYPYFSNPESGLEARPSAIEPRLG